MTDNENKNKHSFDPENHTYYDKSGSKTDSPAGALESHAKIINNKTRVHGITLSFFLVFILPSLLSVAYYSFIASDRYAAGAGFVIRGLENEGSPDLISSYTGMISSGSTTSDSYVVRKYLESPNLLRQLDNSLELRKHYSSLAADWLSRYNNDQSFEDFFDYWKHRIKTSYDRTTGIVTFEVQTFNAEKSKELANLILERVDYLVNSISEKARQDSVKFSLQEVERSEALLLSTQSAISNFRIKNGSVDPEYISQLDTKLTASLEAQLAEIYSRISAISQEVNQEAPMLRQLRLHANALEKQIQIRRSAVGGNSNNLQDTSTAKTLAEYESLKIHNTFAQQRYASALSSLENSRMDANRQQRYLGIFDRPITPEDPVYPRRSRNALLCIAIFFAIWAIGTLLTLAVRDHMR